MDITTITFGVFFLQKNGQDGTIQYGFLIPSLKKYPE